MKTIIGIVFSCAIISISSCSFACDSCDVDSYNSYTNYNDTTFNCGSDYTSNCECTDPGCGPKGYNDCMSRGKCCEAFGNVGAR